jgi:hypothetical protein
MSGTGLFQPADVGLQRVFKHIVKRSASDFFVATICKKLKAGVTPNMAAPPSDLPTLRNATIGWFLDAWKYLRDNPDIVRHAWGACRVPGETRGLSLAYQSVSSNDAYALFRSLCAKDEEFGKELLRLDFTSSVVEDGDEHDEGDQHDDDLMCPPEEIAQRCLDGTSDGVDDKDADADVDFPEILVRCSCACLPNPNGHPIFQGEPDSGLIENNGTSAGPLTELLSDIAVQGGTRYVFEYSG